MRIVFLGTPAAAVPSLDALHAAHHAIPLVVTRADRPRGRSGRPVAPPVARRATELGLEVHQPGRVRGPEFLERLRAVAPDVLVVVAYGRILPPAVLTVAPLGAVNLHFSLLPRYRGAAPVAWALARGEEVTGVSTMCLSEGLDEGDVLLQQEVEIEPGEHAPELESRLAQVGAGLLERTLEALGRGTVVRRAQDPGAATWAPLLAPNDGDIDPAWPAREVEGRVRGFDPWPGAWLDHAGRRLRILDAEVRENDADGTPPGRVIATTAEGLVVACGGGTRLLVRRLQPEGARPMSARDAINGRWLAVGDTLARPER